MNLPATLAIGEDSPALFTLSAALRLALRRASWRIFGTALAISMALDVWLLFDIDFARGTERAVVPDEYISAAITSLLMALAIMSTTLVADEFVARGAKRLSAYSWAVVIGSAAAALTQFQLFDWLDLRTVYDGISSPRRAALLDATRVFFEYLIWGSIIVFIYASRRDALRARERMNKARVHRAEAQRRALESRLQALQARVEPQFLFNTLAQVHTLYDVDPLKAGRALDDLIVYLRAALPHLRESTSTLEREVELANSYLNIARLTLGERFAFDIDVQRSAQDTSMPPMILLPLLDRLLERLPSPSIDGAIHVGARVSIGKLHLEILVNGASVATGRGTDVGDIRDRLRALYGEAASLVVETVRNRTVHVAVEIPHASTQRDHR